MAKKKAKKAAEGKTIGFVANGLEPVSSVSTSKVVEAETTAVIAEKTPAEIDFESRSPAFKELAMPKLPHLERQNRARLQVQSPNKIFFYWSLRSNPFQALQRSLGAETAGFMLVLRLIDIETEREEFQGIEAEGSHWFNTEAGRSYRAEIGFYSTTRPFVRILFSNTIMTPRKSPSPRAASESQWRVSSHKFAEVLDASGFQKDAFDVAIAGDDSAGAERVTHAALSDLLGHSKYSLDDISPEEIRFALLAVASGRALEELRWKIGAALFAILQANAERLAAARAAAAMSEHFEIDETEFEEDEIGPAVFGNSLVHFPRRFKTRTRGEYLPDSSHILGK